MNPVGSGGSATHIITHTVTEVDATGATQQTSHTETVEEPQTSDQCAACSAEATPPVGNPDDPVGCHTCPPLGAGNPPIGEDGESVDTELQRSTAQGKEYEEEKEVGTGSAQTVETKDEDGDGDADKEICKTMDDKGNITIDVKDLSDGDDNEKKRKAREESEAASAQIA